MWFCPVRNQEWIDLNNTYGQKYSILDRPSIKQLRDLTRATAYKSGTDFLRIPQGYWVPRLMGPYAASPSNPQARQPTVTAVGGVMPDNPDPWPRKVSDKTVSSKPFITDECQGGTGTDPAQVRPTLFDTQSGITFYNGHFQNNKLHSVNAAYADGHVETHTYLKLRWQFLWSGQSMWFY
jgi:prepilin-type processing-associated H-X9-DG protein